MGAWKRTLSYDQTVSGCGKLRRVAYHDIRPRTKDGSPEDPLLRVIDETLNQIFREEGVSIIYDFLERESQLKREDISSKTDVFSAGLMKLLGSGAPVIEKLILRNLCHQLELKFVQKKGHSFSDYAKELTERFYVKG